MGSAELIVEWKRSLGKTAPRCVAFSSETQVIHVLTNGNVLEAYDLKGKEAS